MTVVRTIMHILYADLLERVRRYSFLIVIGATIYVGYMLVPPSDAPYSSFLIAGHRGTYNSPWVGTVFGIVSSTLLPLIGFYLVKGAVNRDRDTQVGQIVATTPIRKPLYVLGKWLSNLALLVLILVVLTAIAPVMQIARAEETVVDLWALVAPMWLIGLPTLALAAAAAVLFESIPFLRGGLGNVIYFFLWAGVAVVPAAGLITSGGAVTPKSDLLGMSRTMADLYQDLEVAGIDPTAGTTDLFVPTRGREVPRFAWEGVEWTARFVLERLMWFTLSGVLALAASIPFDRFDPARQRIRPPRARRQPRRGQRLWHRLAARLSRPAARDAPKPETVDGAPHLTPLGGHSTHWQLGTRLLAELRLTFKGQKWWWYAVAAGLAIAILFSPLDASRQYLLPAAWLWPILLWSAMGNREERHLVGPIVFSAVRPVARQLPTTWMAGVLVACATGGSYALRASLAGQWDHLFAWAAGATFVPSLALALGVWSHGSKPFEVIYVLLWYLGPVSGVAALDYMGTSREAIEAGVPLRVLGVTALLLALAVLGRLRQVRK